MTLISPNLRTTIVGSSAGTLIEWYDFFLYGALTSLLGKVFFTSLPASTAYLFSLLAFSAGFLVRPIGALIFGVIGDRWGRKNTFLVTMMLMGVSTVSVGLIPGYETIGLWAPMLLITARLIQGLAVGGEYGGAATFIAEHSPAQHRGLTTSFIQLTCTLGLALALAAVIVARFAFPPDQFQQWGWRVPFLASGILLCVAYWIRQRLDESPLFKERRESNTLSASPLVDSFKGKGRLSNFLLATFGLAGGMTVIFYTSQFYVLTFMTKSALVNDQTASIILLCGIVLATPMFPLCGWLSDKIGRKPVMIAGFLVAGVTYFAVFSALGHATNPKLFDRDQRRDVVLYVVQETCAAQFSIIGTSKPASFCDAARNALAARGVPYRVVAASAGSERASFGTLTPVLVLPSRNVALDMARIQATLNELGFSSHADDADINWLGSIAIVWAMVAYVAMAYAPLAAALSELFPTEIRYTSLSFSYNLSVGWIGGLLPSIAYYLVLATGRTLFGLWYPVSIALAATAITLFFMKDSTGSDIANDLPSDEGKP